VAHKHFWRIVPNPDMTHDYWRCRCGATKVTPKNVDIPGYHEYKSDTALIWQARRDASLHYGWH
jgi:hypothetical protein